MPPDPVPTAQTERDIECWTNPRRYRVLFNPNSGAALSMRLTTDQLRARFEAAGYTATFDTDVAEGLDGRVAAAVDGDEDVVVAAGGDGTITALATGLAQTGKHLAILPLGTANLLARDLGVPLNLDDALDGLRSWRPRQIDLADVNGHAFLHKVVVGVIPSIAAAREEIRGHQDAPALMGFARYMVNRLATARRMAISITSRDAMDRIERVHAVAVANNAYDQGPGKVFSRARLDRGIMTLYVVRHLGPIDALRLGFEMVAGRWREDDTLQIETVRSVTLGSKRATLDAMVDGEVLTLNSPLKFSVHPGALSVLAPIAPS
jgi:diacylglycerol kinase family enzyme